MNNNFKIPANCRMKRIIIPNIRFNQIEIRVTRMRGNVASLDAGRIERIKISRRR